VIEIDVDPERMSRPDDYAAGLSKVQRRVQLDQPEARVEESVMYAAVC